LIKKPVFSTLNFRVLPPLSIKRILGVLFLEKNNLKFTTQKVMLIINHDADRFVVSQSNELVEASFSPALTARAHKVARLLFSLISPEDKDLKMYTITIDALKQYLGYKSDVTWGRFHDDLKDIAQRLNSEPIVIKSEQKLLTAFMIAGYLIDVKAGTVTFEIPLLLRPFLLELKKNFTKYPLVYIPKLRSSYSIRLYELLYQYKTIGWRTIELDALQRMVGSDYELYGDFKRKVIGIAQRDLEEHTDIKFDYDELKTSRKVTAIKFTILSNTPQSKDTQPTTSAPLQTVLDFLQDAIEVHDRPDFSEELKRALMTLGINDKNITKYQRIGFTIITDETKRKIAETRCKGALEAYFKEKLTLLAASKQDENSNPAGFLVKALQEDWQNTEAVRDAKQKEVKKEKQDAYKNLQKLEAQRDALKSQWTAEKQKVYDQLLRDDVAFMEAFEVARSHGGSLRNTIFPPDKSPKQIFTEGAMARNLILVRLEEQHLSEFTALNMRYAKAVRDLDEEIFNLKNRG
jgi:plasmid replication initiation protein